MKTYFDHFDTGGGVKSIVITLIILMTLCFDYGNSQVHIFPVYTGISSQQQQIIEAAITYWENVDNYYAAYNISIEFKSVDLGVNTSNKKYFSPTYEYCRLQYSEQLTTLAQASLFQVNGDGFPLRCLIEVNSNSSIPWNWTMDYPVGGTVDGLSVIHHELCHTLGFADNYPKFNSHITNGPGTNLTFTLSDGSTGMLVPRNYGTHLDETSHPNDLMVMDLPPDIRREPSRSQIHPYMLETAFGNRLLVSVPSNDALIASNFPNTSFGNNLSFGSKNALGIGYEYGSGTVASPEGKGIVMSLIKWDLPTMPVGTHVSDAVFYLRYYGGAYSNTENYLPIPVDVSRLLSDWSESSVTWNNVPSVSNPEVNFIVSPDGPNSGWRDLTPIINYWYNNTNSNYGILLKTNELSFSGKNIKYWASKDNGSGLQKPQLQITYSITPTDPGLPVELSSFIANSSERKIVLQWTTETEIDNLGFDIERKIDSQNTEWVRIGFIEGVGTSNSRHEYQFIDNSEMAGRYFYRLKQVDKNGNFKYSPTIEVDVIDYRKIFDLSQNYPNPFNPSTSFRYSISLRSNVRLSIVTPLGQTVSTLVDEIKEPGTYVQLFNASHLPSGIYFYRIEAVSTTNPMLSLRTTKKMLLIR